MGYGEESAVKYASMGVMSEIENSSSAILSKIVESIGKTAIRRAVFLLFVIGGVFVSLGFASYIWINKQLKQLEERQNDKLDKRAKIQNNKNSEFDKFEAKVLEHMQKTNTKIAEINTDNRSALSKLKKDFDQQLHTLGKELPATIAAGFPDALSKLKKDFDQQLQNTVASQAQMKEELQTQIKQQEHNVITNITGTIDEKQTKQQEDIKKEMSTYIHQQLQKTEESQKQMKEELQSIQNKQQYDQNLVQDVIKKLMVLLIDKRRNTIDEKHTKQQEDIKKEMSTYIHQQLNTLEKELPDAIVAGFPEPLSKLKQDFDQQLQKTEDSRQAQMKKELQTQIMQLEQNVIKNLTGTLDKRLTKLEENQTKQ